ncbi:MAG: methyltransferase [Clostridia bacterium]|nr:methyltransferase [Clostridia bacterium]
MIRTEDLGVNNLKVLQDDEGYCFTSDSVLLARFAKPKMGDVVADFCSGSGIVGFYYYGLNCQTVSSLTFFELQTALYSLSVKSIELNGLSDKVNAVNTRLQDIDNEYAGKFSLILCNPPYMAKDAGALDKDYNVAICRREVELSLEELITAISRCLKYGGRTAIVHRADRLADVICCMRAHGIEPKRVQFVKSGDKEPYLLLIEGVKGGKSGMHVMKVLEN